MDWEKEIKEDAHCMKLFFALQITFTQLQLIKRSTVIDRSQKESE